MPAISVGSVEVDVLPNVQGIYNRLRSALVPAATRAGRDAGDAAGRAFGPAMQGQIGNVGLQIGQRIGQQIASRITASLRTAIRNGVTQGGQTARPVATRQGEETGGAFARSLRARLQAAFRSMPKLDVRLSDTGIDADLARLRARLETLAGKTVGIDIDAETARAEATDIEERLRRIGAAHPNVAVRADTAAAIAQLRLLREQIDEVSAHPAHIRVETDGTFGQRLRAQVQAAEASLPNINLTADSTAAEVEIARLRAQLTALRDVRIGVDMDTATATARIDAIQARLQRLSASDADVAVRVDSAAAAAQLAAIQALVNRLDGQTARVNVRVSGMQILVASALAFGPAIIPALPVVAAGLGAIAAAGVAAAAGIGGIALVAIPAFKQISTVLQAQKAAQDAASQATLRGGQAASQAAQKALQMAGAQQQLASAERNGARQIAQAQQAVRQARQQAADAVVQAARKVQDAERSLADAQRDAKQAQADLTAAHRTAAQELEDINNRLAGSRLSQRDAEIALKEATAQRNAVLRNANATELDKQKALLAYDQAVQRLKEQTLETGRLKTETVAANMAGAEGSKTVTDAQNRVAESQRKVTDQQQALREAQVDTARQVADAQQRVSEATANVAVAQQSAADAVTSAQRQIQSASLSAAGSVDQAAIAQAKYQAELAKLTPAARETLTAYTGLKTAFSGWSKSLQPQVMPIFTRAINGLKNSLPGLAPFVVAAATAIGGLQDRASKGFKSPWWQSFKKDLLESVVPAITGLGVGFANIFKGMAGIVQAFLPHMDSISETMQRITGRFAKWATNLKGSPEFERFLDYSAKMGPILAETLGDVFSGIFNVSRALSPISTVVLKVLGGIFDAIGIVADKAPWLIQLIYGIIVVTKLWAIAQAVFNAIMAANPYVLAALAIVALIGFVVYAYNKFGWFRKAVQAAWDGIKWAAQAVVDWFKGPFVGFFTKTLPGAFQTALNWVKRNWPWIIGALGGPIGLAVVAVIKHWDSIKGAFSSAWDWIKRNVFSPIGTFFTKTIPGWATTFQQKVVAAFNLAKTGIKTAWDGIKSVTRAPVQYVVDFVYNTGIRGVWNKIAGAFGAPKLPEFKFRRGGVMPGYTPGKDVHKFVSPTGGALELSGGEAIMRPEFTRAVGSGFVNTLNAIARSRGAQGVKAALAPAFGGNPAAPTDRSLKYSAGGVTQSFADGGIFGWIKSAGSAALGAGSAAWNKIKEGASWLTDTLQASARAGVKNVVDPLLKSFPGMDTGIGQLIRHIPTRIVDALFGYSEKADEKGAGGIGGPRIQAALNWAKAQAGKPYLWGGVGPAGFDCSGFMGAIENVIRGLKPNSRRWATGAFSGSVAPPGWVKGGASAFRVGITNAGVGHTAGTLGKTNVESRGGDGVVVGARARGYKDGLFTSWYGFKPGSYDSGGYLQPGLNLAYNGTGRPEPVFTRQQANALTSVAARGSASGPASFEGDLYLDSGEFLGKVRGEATAVVHQEQQKLISVLNAS
ncbi:hypothetical protein ACWCPF_25615 [Streptomyces sp. NPDC001858]